MDWLGCIGETMIEIGDLVRLKTKKEQHRWLITGERSIVAGVWLVLEIHTEMALCSQGKKRLRFYIERLEKL
jgi:hypothetical protein